MIEGVDTRSIESKWAKKWEKEGIYKTPTLPAGRPKGPSKDKKTYILGMFPYPSGEGLHTGHVRIYTAVDVMARYLRMKGREVLNPMGWDSFGLPAENSAIKEGKNPKEMVPINEANFKRQCKMIGLSYDWDREFSTADPSYYKWTQWIFLKLYSIKNKKGERLIYRKEVPINWCPTCLTGLADEEVLPNGTHERCANAVTKKEITQWLFRITDYADRLLNDLEGLDWPKGIIEMQKNWIGRSEGTTIKFPLVKPDGTHRVGEIEVFTTRTDTLFGVTAMVLAPEHHLVASLSSSKFKIQSSKLKEIREYVEKSKQKSELERTDLAKDKTGVPTGLYCINPANGKKIPIWIGDYVVGTYGGGAIMVVPAHDQRDWEFAKKYDLPIIEVISPLRSGGNQSFEEQSGGQLADNQAYTGSGKLINSGQFNGLESEIGKKKITQWLKSKGIGEKSVSFKLRDWVFSRQRYWGEPIPLLYCSNCAAEVQSSKSKVQRFDIVKDNGEEYAVIPIPDDQLPVELPSIKSYKPAGTGKSPLANEKEWVNTKCPECGGKALRETDTMPNWAGSSWYFLRFPSAGIKNSKLKIQNSNISMDKIWEKEYKPEMKKWLPVDWYLGGAEHAVLHLLYSRFWVKALKDLKLVSIDEPFSRLRSVGLVLAQDGRKMSKSYGNVVNPDDVIEAYGADTLRVYEMFVGPWDQSIAWSTVSVIGARRFVDKVWSLVARSWPPKPDGLIKEPVGLGDGPSGAELKRKLHQTIKKVGDDIESQKFNTAISTMMEFVNEYKESESGLSKEDTKRFLRILAPFTPFVAEEAWEKLGGKFSVHQALWPKYDKSLISEGIAVIVIQVNGEVRGKFNILKKGLTKSKVEKEAKKIEGVKKFIKGKKIKNTIYVAGKLINFVTN